MAVRAARLHEIGGAPQVDEIDPPPGAGLAHVSAAALNPVDISMGSGRFYGGTPQTPYVIGGEAVGLAEDGRRVWVRGRGLMAELVDPGPGWVFDVPDGVSDELALACGIAGLTGWLAVSWRAPVGPEDTVLVLGASGTLGSVAVQGAKVLGARRVIGAARRTELVPAAADEVHDLAGDAELPEATVIVDALWGEPFERALAAAAAGVRVVQLGQSAGPTATLPSGFVRGKMANILGHSLFSLPRDVASTGYRQLCEHARDGRIAFKTETFPLDRVTEGWARQASGSPGAKIIVSIA
jgi:NADPH:quinone reductase-like Zn-dependent oxidoreductase